MLRRITLSFWNTVKWRKKCRHDSTSVPHLQIGLKESWKLCLNLCSRKWLRTVHSLVTSLIPLGLWKLKKLLKVGVMNCRIFLFKNVKTVFTPKISIELVPFNTTRKKNEFLKKLCFVLNKGVLSIFLVLKAKCRCGTILARELGWLSL